jgi:hypothetical protein
MRDAVDLGVPEMPDTESVLIYFNNWHTFLPGGFQRGLYTVMVAEEDLNDNERELVKRQREFFGVIDNLIEELQRRGGGDRRE